MTSLHFETFISAFSALPEELRILNGDYVICPPVVDFSYRSTPQNALTFAEMGVDGVHYAILKINNEVRDDSPIVHISPMDSEDVIVIAGSFLEYLADGCGVPIQEMLSIINAERNGQSQLVLFLQERFNGLKLLEEHKTDVLDARFGSLIVRKAE